jgi:hypothetical protein
MDKSDSKHRAFKLVRLEGGSVVITLGNLIDKNWQMVKLVPLETKQGESVTIRFDKVA